MKFTLTITLGNDAMQTPLDIAEALKDLAANMERHTAGDPFEPITMNEHTRISGRIIDANGNTVGDWKVTK